MTIDDIVHQSYYLQCHLPMQGYPNMPMGSQGRDQQLRQQHFFSPSHQLFMTPSQIQLMMEIP